MSLVAAFEGDTDFPVVEKLAADAGFEHLLPIDAAGKGQIDPKLAPYDVAARHSPWLVLRDLDHDAPCAPTLVRELLPTASRWMCFRVSVRAVEAWLMADADGFAKHFEVDRRHLPIDPDREKDPKATLVSLARRSHSTAIERAMVPAPGAKVGPGYETELITFGSEGWSLDRAAKRSDSLRRARKALRGLGERWAKVGGDGDE